MADIGDMNTYFPQSVIETLNTEGIIEILCIVRVNSTGENIAEILTTCDFIGRNLIAYLIGCIFHSLWIFVWKSVLGKDCVHLSIVITLLSEDINNTCHDASMLCIRPLYYLYNGSVTILGVLQFALRNKDTNRHWVSWNEIGKFTVSLDNTDKLILSPLDNLDNLCLTDMLCTSCHHRNLDTVAVERPHRVTLCHEYRLVGAIGHEGALAIELGDERTFENRTVLVKLVGILTCTRQEIVPCHFLKYVNSEHLQRMRIEMTLVEYLFERICLTWILAEELFQQSTHLFLV